MFVVDSVEGICIECDTVSQTNVEHVSPETSSG
jgi:hypothetical protein